MKTFSVWSTWQTNPDVGNVHLVKVWKVPVDEELFLLTAHEDQSRQGEITTVCTSASVCVIKNNMDPEYL